MPNPLKEGLLPPPSPSLHLPGCSVSMPACQTMSCRLTGPGPRNSGSTTHPAWGCTIWSCLWEDESNIQGASGRADVPTESPAWEELFIVSPLETPYLCSGTSMSQLPSNTHTYPNPFSHLSELSTCFIACILCLYIFCTVFYFGLALP